MSLNEKQVRNAIKALLAYEKKRATEEKKNATKDLLAGDEKSKSVQLVITTKLMPDKRRIKPERIILTHAIHKSPEVCLITKDPQRQFKELLEAKGVQGITKVIGVQKLKSKFSTYEAKRQLCDSFDLFLADDRVLPVLPNILGKYFFTKKKHPSPVDMKKNNLKGEIESALHSTYLHFSMGTCVTLKMGNTEFGIDKLVENIMMATPEIVSKIPKKWNNIQSIHVKTTDSTALPVYVSVPKTPASEALEAQ
ncbi:ribosomal protein L1/ribosomal biogenesis protein [Gaertneriomyces semiglobifer]|nr:ribosomal protein L1/ribosomal biogenesis protein [Gaertneriomyces semiglobifer]